MGRTGNVLVADNYSPSLVMHDHLHVGGVYTVSEFARRFEPHEQVEVVRMDPSLPPAPRS